MLCLVRRFSYTPRAMFNEESLTFPMLVLVRSFSYTPHAMFGEEFLLHS